MLKILGRDTSSNVMKVLWACAEMGIAYDREDAGREFGVVETDAFFALNPNRRVPVMIEDDFVLWESNAIVRYLSAKHGMGGLCPDDPQRRADADRWMDWQAATVGRVMRPLTITMFRTQPQDRDPAIVARQVAEAGRYWAMLDARLADGDYVVGNSLTMGDIPLGCYAWRWFSAATERPALVNLDDWYRRLCERPAYAEHVMVPMAA